jgi:predicted deacylase
VYRVDPPTESFSISTERGLEPLLKQLLDSAQFHGLEVYELIADESYPMYAIAQPNYGQPHSVLVQGTVHGNETAGLLTILELITEFDELVNVYPDVRFSFIPVANPFGFSNGSRYDGEGYNVGVDFTSCRSKAAAAVCRYVAVREFDLVIDLHENEGSRYYLHVYDRNVATELRTFIGQATAAGFRVAASPTYPVFKRLADEPGISYLPMSLVGTLARVAQRETLPMRISRDGNIIGIVTETGRRRPEAERIAFNLMALRFSLQRFLHD